MLPEAENISNDSGSLREQSLLSAWHLDPSTEHRRRLCGSEGQPSIETQPVRHTATLLTPGKHEEVFEPALTHGGGCLAGQPLVLIV